MILSTDKRGLKFFDKDIYKFEVIDTPRLNNIFLLPLNIFKILFLIIKSFLLLRSKKIEKVISTGGYMSLPLILAGRLLKLKIYLLEPNHVLGRANKHFLSSCVKIFCYSKDLKNFPNNFKNKISMINPLVKKSFYDLKISTSFKDKITLLIVGGSQGADIFDKNLKNSIVNISKKNSIRIIQQTSIKNVSSLSNFYLKNNIENKVFSFEKNFANIIEQADLCITRAGASTLAELSVSNLPFIAVPLPTSKDNHQLENALFYKNNQCCWFIEQKNFEETIDDLLISIFKNKNEYLDKKENLKKLNYQNTWINVNEKILRVINEN